MSLQFGLEADFLEACLSTPKQAKNYSPPLLPAKPTIDEEIGVHRLTDRYPNAFTDFYGSKKPCIYKTGPEWHKRTGNQAQGIYWAAHPIYNHPIRSSWLSLLSGKSSINLILLRGTPFCPFVITIAVESYSLPYDNAVVASDAVETILKEAGFPDIQVALIESVVHRPSGRKLMPFNPLVDPIAALRGPSTGTLGTGAFYFRLNETDDDDRVMLLTCAHVAHPPPLLRNTARKKTSQAHEEIVVLGTKAYENAIHVIMKEIGDQATYIESWNKSLKMLGHEEAGEDLDVTAKRNEIKGLVNKAKKIIERANQLHSEVTKYRTTAQQRVIGSVYHCEEIKLADWNKFTGNKIFVGGNKTPADFVNAMFPQVSDRKNFNVPNDVLLQADGVVPQEEFSNPQDLDILNQKALLCVKNVRPTDTTYGRVNGLESFTRHYKEHNIKKVSMEIAVLGYDMSNLEYTKFSDSGSGVVGRDGRIIGLLTGGEGPTNETDIT
ncbi:unnamed protein product [Rhizoctonia solani]|uniref:Uncharacterized protein n=1 Tax=Rhizoctonia solani TaxID=456999 RepID=A0A8H2WVE9_9AGAM|nr:unnamed protein product [Rhizoctonia solani]